MLRFIIFCLLAVFSTEQIAALEVPVPKKSKRLKIKEKRVKTQKAATRLLNRKKITPGQYDAELTARIKSQDLATATALVLAGASLNRPENQESPLHLTARYGDADLLEVMREHGVDLNQKATTKEDDLTGTGMSALFFAVQGNNTATLKYLHQKGLDIHATDSSRHFPQTLMQRAAIAGSLDCFRYLYDNGGNIQQRYGIGFTYLHAAARFGHLDMVQFMIAHGIDVNARSNAALTPIMMAGMGKQAHIIRYLTENGADINAQDNHAQRTLMHYVASMGDAELVKYLTDRGARMDIKDRDGTTAAEIWEREQKKK